MFVFVTGEGERISVGMDEPRILGSLVLQREKRSANRNIPGPSSTRFLVFAVVQTGNRLPSHCILLIVLTWCWLITITRYTTSLAFGCMRTDRFFG